MSKTEQDKDNPLPTLQSQIEVNEELRNNLLEEDDYSQRKKKPKTSGVNMFFSAVYLVFLILTLLFSSTALFAKGSARTLKPNLETESLVHKDSRKMFTLFNGLKVAFITTNETKTSAISLAIRAGTGHEEFKGVARLVQLIFEHKLKQNPILISVSSSITHDRTYYTVEMNDTLMLEALEYMANVIIESDISNEEIQRALKHLEYVNKNNVIDNNREFIESELLYHYYNDNGDNDQSRFKQLILSDDLNRTSDEIHNYIETLYTSNRMSIAMVNNNQQLTDLNARLKAHDILCNFRLSDSLDEEEDDDGQSNSVEHYEYTSKIFAYHSDQNSISVYYLNATFNRPFYYYFKYSLDTYGAFYLYNESEDLIKSIEPFLIKVSIEHEALGLRVSLTKKGYQSFDRVVKGLLGYVNNFCSDFEKRLAVFVGYSEIKAINEQNIVFNAKTYSSTRLAADFANKMFIGEEKESLRNILHRLPKVIMIGDEKYPSSSFYAFDYFKHHSDIQKELKVELNDFSSQPIEDFSIKQKRNEANKYISKLQRGDLIAPSNQGEAGRTVLFNSSHVVLYYKEIYADHSAYTLVKLQVRLNFENGDKQLDYFTMLVYEAYLRRSVKEELSEAMAAGNAIVIEGGDDLKSITISIRAYHDKIARITGDIIELMLNYKDNDVKSELNEEVEEIFKGDSNKRAYLKAEDYFYLSTGKRRVDIHNLKTKQFNITAASQRIAKLATKATLITSMKGIIYGCINKDTFLSKKLKEALDSINSPPVTPKQNPSFTGVTIKRIGNPNINQLSNAVSNYFLFGKASHYRDHVLTMLLSEMIRERFIDIAMTNADYVSLERVIDDDNDSIWLNFIKESSDKSTDAIQLDKELDTIIKQLKEEIEGNARFHEDLLVRLKQRYLSVNYTEEHSIDIQAERELKAINGNSIDMTANELMEGITLKEVINLLKERVVSNPTKLSIQLFSANASVPNMLKEEYALNKSITSKIEVL